MSQELSISGAVPRAGRRIKGPAQAKLGRGTLWLTCLGQPPPCGEPGPKINLYHYTPYLSSILQSQELWPSTGANAFYGEGQYMTDISPSDAGAHTQGDLAQALFGDPVHW